MFTELHRFAVFALVLLAQMLAGRSATTCNALAAHAIVLAYLGTSTGLALVLLPTVLADGFASTFFAPASHAVSGSGTMMCTRSSKGIPVLAPAMHAHLTSTAFQTLVLAAPVNTDALAPAVFAFVLDSIVRTDLEMQ